MTTSILRPNGTITSADPGVTGAASQHAALNDDSDSSYVAVHGKENAGSYDVGTFTLPAGAVTMQVRVRVRAKKVADGTVTATVLSTAGTTATLSGQPLSSFAEISGAWSPATLSQAQVDALIVRLAVLTDSAQAQFAEAFVDVKYVAKPVTNVDGVSPDPYTASNIIPISWVNTLDADGGSQTRYHLKVFTDAQYGASGFDPETSTPYYDSEVVISSSTSTSTGVLDTGDTYRAYVKVAQTVNGALHWSDWDYDTFTVDVDTADIDTVVAAGSNSTASITVSVERDTLSEAWNYVEVQRSIDNGATWQPVRGATYVDATADPDTFTVVDYEVGNDVAVIYRARATLILSGVPITGAWLTSSPSASWSSPRLWVKSPSDPTLNRTFLLQSTISPSYGTRRGVFPVIGAAAPVVISDVRSRAAGMLSLHSDNIGDGAEILALLSEPVLLVHAPLDWNLAVEYVSLGSVVQARRSKVFSSTSTWTADFVEVDAPADPDASAP